MEPQRHEPDPEAEADATAPPLATSAEKTGQAEQAETPASPDAASDTRTDELTDEVWDVAVVGAGPAGASAAYAAAAAGRRVVLLDKAAPPRYKTCGGGLIAPSRDALPEGMRLPLRDRVGAVTFSHEGRKRFTRRYARGTLFGLVNRDEFDHRLVRYATEAGASLVTGVTVTGVEQHGPNASGKRVAALTLADGRAVRARAVVGADGSASRVSRHVGVEFAQVDLGLEAEIPVPRPVAEDFAGRVVIDWGPIPGSYGWVFPKGETLTVGVIASRGQGAATRTYLRDFVARLGLAGFEPTLSSGHLTRCRTEESPLTRGRVLVAGDAAGLLDPWTREGISFALRSGRLAGEWAVRVAETANPVEAKRQALNYAFAIKAGLGVEMTAARHLLGAFTRRPALFHAAVSYFPPAWHAFTRVVSGRTTFSEVLSRNASVRRLVTKLG